MHNEIINLLLSLLEGLEFVIRIFDQQMNLGLLSLNFLRTLNHFAHILIKWENSLLRLGVCFKCHKEILDVSLDGI